ESQCLCGELPSRIPIIEPGLGRVGVTAPFPEPALIPIEEFDLANPLRAFPRVEARRDHAARAAVIARERLTFPRVHEEHVLLDGASERKGRRVRAARG